MNKEASFERMTADNTMFILVDAQTRLLPAIAEHEKLKKNICRLGEGLRLLEVCGFISEQYPKGIGPTDEEIAASFDAENVFEKTSFSCMQTQSMKDAVALHGENLKYVILAGTETHICVLQTALDLKAMGLTPVIAADCVGSRNLSDRQLALDMMRADGIRVVPTESIFFEIMLKKEHPAFKAVQKLIK